MSAIGAQNQGSQSWIVERHTLATPSGALLGPGLRAALYTLVGNKVIELNHGES